MRLTPEEVESVANLLLGTTGPEETAINSVKGTELAPGDGEHVVDHENLAEVFNRVERCNGCGWWFEVHDLDEDNLECFDCREDA